MPALFCSKSKNILLKCLTMKTNLLFIWKSKLCLALIMMKACAGFSFRKAGRALLFPSADGQKEAGAAEAEIDVIELNGRTANSSNGSCHSQDLCRRRRA